MSWQAQTAYTKLTEGASLFVFQSGQMDGEKPSLSAPCVLSIEVNEKWIEANVTDYSEGTATVVITNGTRFRMTRRADNEPKSGIVFSGSMYGEDWIIREFF